MSEHTRGPWEANGDTVYAKDSGMRVCDIRGWGYLTGKGVGALGLPDDQAFAIQLANARLIAAAPDVTEALKSCLNYIENTESELGIRLTCGDAARAALAKAEGRP